METTPELEAVAKAINEARLTAPHPWFHADPAKCAFSQHLARAALQAIREPTDAMWKAAQTSAEDYYDGDAIGWGEIPKMWKAMIDAILAATGESVGIGEQADGRVLWGVGSAAKSEYTAAQGALNGAFAAVVDAMPVRGAEK